MGPVERGGEAGRGRPNYGKAGCRKGDQDDGDDEGHDGDEADDDDDDEGNPTRKWRRRQKYGTGGGFLDQISF